MFNSFTPEQAIWPINKHRKIYFSGGKVTNIVSVLMAVLYNSLHFHLIYLSMLPPEKRIFI